MAIAPKKKIQNPLSSPGGGVKGGSMGTGGAGRVTIRPGGGTKPAPKPKVKLNPEPSSVTVKPGKTSLGPESANAANKRLLAERNRTSTMKNQKSALKAANKPAKYKSADAARKQSIDKANAANLKNKLGQGPKLTPAQRIAYERGFTAFNNMGKKAPSKLSQAIAKKAYPKGIPSTKNK